MPRDYVIMSGDSRHTAATPELSQSSTASASKAQVIYFMLYDPLRFDLEPSLGLPQSSLRAQAFVKDQLDFSLVVRLVSNRRRSL